MTDWSGPKGKHTLFECGALVVLIRRRRSGLTNRPNCILDTTMFFMEPEDLQWEKRSVAYWLFD